MKDLKITLAYVITAALLLLIAVISSPKRITPNIFSDVGEVFYPDFTNPQDVATVEIYEKESMLTPTKLFKVERKEGKWIIPSHYNYPTDVTDRLGKTLSALIGLKKDTIRSDNPNDHEELGVVDPQQPPPNATKGFGRRIIIKNFKGSVLADFIISKDSEKTQNIYYVRIPGQRRTYGARIEPEISSKFEDWVETDLLKISSYNIVELKLNIYSIDEATGSIKSNELSTLIKKDSDNWELQEGLKENEELNKEAIKEITETLDDLKIVDVRPKPQALSEALKAKQYLKPLEEIVKSLIKKGYFFTNDKQFITKEGEITIRTAEGDFYLVSNEGEIIVKSDKGVVYVLRFGEIVVSEEEQKKENEKKGDNRYLFITVTFDESLIPQVEPPKETNPDGTPKTDEEKKKEKEEFEKKVKEREDKITEGKKFAEEMTNRFADWFYVISDESYKKLRKTRNELVKQKEEEKKEEKKEENK